MQQSSSSVDNHRISIFVVLADAATALESPARKVHCLVFDRGIARRLVPEGDLGIGGKVPRGTNNHHVSNEGASGIGKAGMVDERCHGPDASRGKLLGEVRVFRDSSILEVNVSS